MVYLLNMVIFLRYVTNNQRVSCSHISIKPTDAHVSTFSSDAMQVPTPIPTSTSSSAVLPGLCCWIFWNWKLSEEVRCFSGNCLRMPKNRTFFHFAKLRQVIASWKDAWWSHWALAEEVAGPRHRYRGAESASAPETGDRWIFGVESGVLIPWERSKFYSGINNLKVWFKVISVGWIW
jgi:hypothetical protein